LKEKGGGRAVAPQAPKKNILFFKIHFHNGKNSYEISAINIGNFLGKFSGFGAFDIIRRQHFLISFCKNGEK
jgi:hypothetical protein